MPNKWISGLSRQCAELVVRWYERARSRLRYNHLLFVAVLLTSLFSFWLSFQLRFDFEVPESYYEMFLYLAPYVALTKALIFFLLQGHSTNWRYVGLRDAVAVGIFAGTAAVLLYAARILGSSFSVPRGVLVIDALCTFVLTGGVRVSARFVRESLLKHLMNGSMPKNRSAVIIGAGDAGELLMREIRRNAQSGLTIKAFFDDDRSKRGMSIHGVRVVGTVDELPKFVVENPIETAIVAIPSANRSQMHRINAVLSRLGIPVKTLPSYLETLESTASLGHLRDLNITDLLGREEIAIDSDQLNELIAGKIVMVTGAGGSIGSELCRQILKRGPSSLIMLEYSENNLFHIHRKLSAEYEGNGSDVLVPLLADARSRLKLLNDLEHRRPHVIFHAAAHKHVGLQELHPYECFKNNVGGIQSMAKLAHELGVERFLLISTDKAVNPTSVMGATKRICELYCQAYGNISPTVFMAVRFGNVLASEGSVVPIFMDQIAKGGPLTVTHPDVQRYFMTIPEAVALVLQAAAIGQSSQLLILDMGKPVRIVDLAKHMIALAGEDPETFPIVYTGLRPGEKLFEELACSRDVCIRTDNEKINIYNSWVDNPLETIARIDRYVTQAYRSPQTFNVRKALKSLVPEYTCPGEEELELPPAGQEPRPPLYIPAVRN